jgi:hypothetical protein
VQAKIGRPDVGMVDEGRAYISLEREFSAPHLVKGAEGEEGRPHRHRYRVSVRAHGDPDTADVAQLLDDAIRATSTAAYDQSASPISIAYWFREHFVFALPDSYVEVVRYDRTGDIRVGVPG